MLFSLRVVLLLLLLAPFFRSLPPSNVVVVSPVLPPSLFSHSFCFPSFSFSHFQIVVGDTNLASTAFVSRRNGTRGWRGEWKEGEMEEGRETV